MKKTIQQVSKIFIVTAATFRFLFIILQVVVVWTDNTPVGFIRWVLSRHYYLALRLHLGLSYRSRQRLPPSLSVRYHLVWQISL